MQFICTLRPKYVHMHIPKYVRIENESYMYLTRIDFFRKYMHIFTCGRKLLLFQAFCGLSSL